MGASVSKNESTFDVVSKELSESITSSFVSVATQSLNTSNPTQLVKIVGSAGRDFNVSDITQKMVARVDVSQFLKNITETDLRSRMNSSLEAVAKENQAVEAGLTIGGSYAQNTSKTAVRQENVARVVNSYNYQQFTSDVNNILTSQTIDLKAFAGRDVNIDNIDQFVQVEILSKQIADNMTKTLMDIINESSVEAKKEITQATKTGFSFSLGQVMIFVIIFVVIVGIAGGVWYFKGGGREMIEKELAKRQ